MNSLLDNRFKKGLPLMAAVVLSFFWLVCSKSPEQINGPKPVQQIFSTATVKEVSLIQKRHAVNLMDIPGVVGVGIGQNPGGHAIIRVFTVTAGISGIPALLDGVPVEQEITGNFHVSSDPKTRFARPVPIGVSAGHLAVTAGTIGCRVKDTDGNLYILSNNHVLAYSNEASMGDHILQPGPYDGGVDPVDEIATLFDFEPIDFSTGVNTIDAAIASTSGLLLRCATPPDDGYGKPASQIVDASIGQGVQKYGRTTKLTHGEVTEISVTIKVCYECGDPMCLSCSKMATFENQIAISPGGFSQGGDSGSLIVTDDEQKNPVALLYAASSTRTLANPIGAVLQRFGVSIDNDDSGTNYPPTAEFSFVISDRTVAFTDMSTDSDGEIVTWNWNFGDENSSSDQNPSHTYAEDGSYTVVLTVTDDGGATNFTSKQVTIGEPVNISPIADFSHTSSGLNVAFTDRSSDPDGSITGWNWDFGDGDTATEQNPNHTYATGGTYTVSLTVTDDDGATGSVVKEITAGEPANEPPDATFFYNVIGLSVSFFDQSTDSDGYIMVRSWDFGDGTTGTGPNPTHTYAGSATYAVTLTVTDNDGASGSITKEVTVGAPVNNPPSADFSYNVSGNTIMFLDRSTDSDGFIMAWHWDFGDGATGTGPNPNHTYSSGGSYNVTLTVTDNDGASNAISQEVTVGEPSNYPPIAEFTYTANDLSVSFTDQSTDSDGSIVAWSWSFGDGSTSTQQNPTHTYSGAGSYNVTLTVTDDRGSSSSHSEEISVSGPANNPPSAEFFYNKLDRTVSFFDQSTDSDGFIVSRSWDFGDGTTGTGPAPQHTYKIDGTYTVTLTVTDNDQATDTHSEAVTVSAPANSPPTAKFFYNVLGLTVSFFDQSTDPDGFITSRRWDFGDGTTGTGLIPRHTYADGGTYTVTLTVTDNRGATGSTAKEVTLLATPRDVHISATVRTEKNQRYVDLEWSGFTSKKVNIYRDGELLKSTKNDGFYSDRIQDLEGTHTYQICEPDGSACSDPLDVDL